MQNFGKTLFFLGDSEKGGKVVVSNKRSISFVLLRQRNKRMLKTRRSGGRRKR